MALAESFAAGAAAQQQAPLTVRVRALTGEESRRYFGGSLKRLGVQPVWLQVTNDGDAGARYLPILTDPNYFSPQEVAQQLHGWFSGAANARVDALFAHTMMPDYLAPHSVTAGFVYTHADGGLKFVTVALLAGQRLAGFHFALPIPGREYAVQRVDFAGLYPAEQVEELRLEQLRARLRELPCCVKDKAGEHSGDPAEPGDHRRWHRSRYSRSPRAAGTLNEPGRCPQLPVDGQGVPAALAVRHRASKSAVPLRALPGHRAAEGAQLGQPPQPPAPVARARSPSSMTQVRIGQISRDIGIKLTTKSWYLTTHRISPYVDQDRDYLLQDLVISGRVQKVGFVSRRWHIR